MGERETGFLIDVGTSGVHLHQAKASDPVSRDWAGLPIQVTLSFPSYYLFLNVQWKRATSKSCCKSNTAGETQLLGSSAWATYSQAIPPDTSHDSYWAGKCREEKRFR